MHYDYITVRPQEFMAVAWQLKKSINMKTLKIGIALVRMLTSMVERDIHNVKFSVVFRTDWFV